MSLSTVYTWWAGFYNNSTYFKRQTSEPTGDRDMDISNDSALLTSTIPS